MLAKTQMMHEGKLYDSMPAAARLLGTTTAKLKQIIGPEGIEYCNFRVNGPLWLSAQDLAGYLHRRDQKTSIDESPFCETNLAVAFQNIPNSLKAPSHQTQLCRHPGKCSRCNIIVLGSQPLTGAPVHLRGFIPGRISDTRAPAKTLPNPVRSPHRSIIVGFPLTLIGQLAAMPTSEYFTAKENRRAPPAPLCRT